MFERNYFEKMGFHHDKFCVNGNWLIPGSKKPRYTENIIYKGKKALVELWYVFINEWADPRFILCILDKNGDLLQNADCSVFEFDEENDNSEISEYLISKCEEKEVFSAYC